MNHFSGWEKFHMRIFLNFLAAIMICLFSSPNSRASGHCITKNIENIENILKNSIYSKEFFNEIVCGNKDDVINKIEITIYVVSKAFIAYYSNDTFHDHFNGFSFEINSKEVAKKDIQSSLKEKVLALFKRKLNFA